MDQTIGFSEIIFSRNLPKLIFHPPLERGERAIFMHDGKSIECFASVDSFKTASGKVFTMPSGVERDRSNHGLYDKLVNIDGYFYKCISVEMFTINTPTIKPEEGIGLLVDGPLKLKK